jgi:predicted N-acetyltransferase YhbS
VITVAHLADYPESIPTLAEWFRIQWPDYYAGRTRTEIEQEFRAEAVREGLPLRLVAFESGELAGTIHLRGMALRTLLEFHPGLGGLYVHGSHRGRGVGTELVRTGMDLAHEQGYEIVYAATASATGILKRLGWEQVASALHDGEQLGIYRFVTG